MMKSFALTMLILLTVSTTSFAVREAYIGYEDMHPGDTWEDDWARYLRDKLEDWNYGVVDYRWHDYYFSHPANYWGAWADSQKDGNGWDDSSYDDGTWYAPQDGVDNYDIAFVYAHGVNKYCGSGGYYVSTGMGDGENLHVGNLSRPSTYNDVYWGDTDLNSVIWKSCAQLQHCVWNGGGYDPIDGAQLGMVMGYHGNSTNSEGTYNRFKTFVTASKYDLLGDNWVDDLTVIYGGSNNDDCATAVVYANNETNADRIYEESGFMDYETASKGDSYYYGVDGCNPYNGITLNL